MNPAVLVLSEIRKELGYAAGRGPKRKIAFEHLPKCGGMSLIALLKANVPCRKTYDTNRGSPIQPTAEFKKLPKGRRHRFDLLVGHQVLRLLDDCDPACFRITVLREPVDRLASHYYYAKETPHHYLHDLIHDRNLSLEAYATIDVSNELNNWYTTHFSGIAHGVAMRHPKRAVERAVNTLRSRFDCVGFLDRMDEFVAQLSRECGLRVPRRPAHTNVTKSRPERVDTGTVEVLRERNALDVEVYETLRQLNGLTSRSVPG